MTPQSRPAFERGVRLRQDPDGPMLLIPEGLLALNEPAAATLELVDGRRSVEEIAESLTLRFDVDREEAIAGVCDLLARLAERGFVTG